MVTVKTKRVYEEASSEDGYRILTERLWPRGVSKERAKLDQWMKGVAPSHDLRKWFNHDPDKWDEFKDRYRKELYGSEDIQKLIKLAEQKETITFIYASKDEEYNSTVVLKEFIEQLLS
ncbi:MAG: hypothetical protein CL670_15160 [Balneola sp.]|jgi:uncharacterized protein YeaO (DUF488 family)|nr:hypothetical protein [Balneola sp.]MBE80497.1 hypothetical protein [Balneola sp.]|tara:strand:+ start:193 stop:549 length:357 start_codon:yes stop_codon:yes gene_type:complete